MTNRFLHLAFMLIFNCLLLTERSNAQELTARFDYGTSDILGHAQTTFDYYLNKKYGVNLGLDFGFGEVRRYSTGGGAGMIDAWVNSTLFYKQLKLGAVRRFFVGKSFIEPIVGVAYCIEPTNIKLGGAEKVSNDGTLITGGIELQFAAEYNITKKWALRLQSSANNTDASFSFGIRYSFFYNEK
jgi:hypothetical protein